jgi:hypothetical protein
MNSAANSDEVRTVRSKFLLEPGRFAGRWDCWVAMKDLECHTALNLIVSLRETVINSNRSNFNIARSFVVKTSCVSEKMSRGSQSKLAVGIRYPPNPPVRVVFAVGLKIVGSGITDTDCGFVLGQKRPQFGRLERVDSVSIRSGRNGDVLPGKATSFL